MQSAIVLVLSIPIILLIPIAFLSALQNATWLNDYCSNQFKNNWDNFFGMPIFSTWCSIFPDIPTMFILIMALGIITLFVVVYIRHYYMSRL